MIAEAKQGLPVWCGGREGAGLPSVPGAGRGHPCRLRQARLVRGTARATVHRQAVRWVRGCKARFERGDVCNYKKSS